MVVVEMSTFWSISSMSTSSAGIRVVGGGRGGLGEGEEATTICFVSICLKGQNCRDDECRDECRRDDGEAVA